MILPALSRGGAERQCLALAKELKNLGWKIDLLLLRDLIEWEKQELENFNKIYHFGIKNSFLLIRSNYQVHLFWMSIPILLGRLFLSSKNRYTIRASRINSKLLFLFKITRYFSGKTSFNSKYSVDQYVEHKLVKNENLFYIPNYTRNLMQNFTLNSTFSPINQEIINLVMVAHWRNNKDHSTLFESLSILENKVQIKLHLFGDTGAKDEMKELAKTKGVFDKCVFHGIVENPWNLINPDINILSSNYEGTPNAIMEGMSLGIPYIMSDIPELIYLDNTLKGGFLFQKGNPLALANTIEKLISQKKELQLLGKKGKENLLKFYDKDYITQKWLKFLKIDS